MISLDSVYAMLARPPLPEVKPKNGVKPVVNTAAITADSHEQPQAQLPANLDRRRAKKDRRKNLPLSSPLDPALERRGKHAKDRRCDSQQPCTDSTQTDASFPHIDVNI
ncbi:hypothetical protein [Shewanella youngdeokensis]|uniref:Uncharacterized protein n=1 Tax=Shewanella youngdeokensis TaxID=2999068 RepID=A0ABZ0JZH8_9GAMM|nr:hypothetical protein RGE70_17070 [Shewanella sp. DAU334]